MDPVEDFSFKPITEGLGFHRKKVELKEQMKTARVASESLSGYTPSKAPPKTESLLTKTAPKAEAQLLKNPLPKREAIQPSLNPVAPAAPTATPPSTKPSKDVIDEIVKNFKKPGEGFVEEKSMVPAGPKVIINPTKPEIDPASHPLPWSVTAFFIDALLVVAMFVAGLIATLVITEADLAMMIDKNIIDQDMMGALVAIGLTMIFSYMSLSRIFMGSSIGEMVFDLQLGTHDQQKDFTYNLKVMARSFLAIVSGLLVVPLFSMILRQDYLGDLCGLRLYKKARRGK